MRGTKLIYEPLFSDLVHRGIGSIIILYAPAEEVDGEVFSVQNSTFLRSILLISNKLNCNLQVSMGDEVPVKALFNYAVFN